MEIWKTIEGFEDYEISTFGNVKSKKCGKERILKPHLHKYCAVNLVNNSKTYSRYIHKLVAIAFLNHKPCGLKLVVNHKDFNRQNNHVDNLEIVTNRENTNKKHIESKSKYTGVFCNNSLKIKKWFSTIYINKKRIHLGYFENEYNAHLAYQNELSKH